MILSIKKMSIFSTKEKVMNNNPTKTIDLNDMSVSLITRISKSGNEYTVLSIFNDKFTKNVFLEPSELQLLKLLHEIAQQKSNFLDEDED